jgi:hypothetical protein
MVKEINLYWTLQRIEDYRGPDSVRTHQLRKARSGDGRSYHIGGLGYREELFTRTITPDGQLFVLQPEKDTVNIGLVGGVNGDYRYTNTGTFEQLRCLTNDIRSLINLNPEVIIDATALHQFGVLVPDPADSRKMLHSFEAWLIAIKAGRGFITKIK